MGNLFSWTTGFLFAGFWLFCVLDAFFWHWITDTLTERFDDCTLWMRKRIAAGCYYTSATLLGVIFYFGLFLPSVTAPAATIRLTVPVVQAALPIPALPTPVTPKGGHLVPVTR